MQFHFTRTFSDAAGDSHFADESVEMTSAGTIGFLSQRWPVKELIFRQVVADYDYDFHTAPQRQFLVLLDGQIEIETSLGEKRSFSAGDVVLLEDTEGKGHRTRNLIQAERKSLFIVL